MTHNDVLDLFHSKDLVSIGFQADAMRKRLHPEPVISYGLRVEMLPDRSATLELTAQSTLEQRFGQLSELRKQQEATQQFLCFTLIASAEVTASEYLKMLAISRLYLDNIAHAQASVTAIDTKLAQVAIRFGANDLGAVDLENRGQGKAITEEQVRRLIRDAGLIPKRRDNLFQTYFLY